MEPERAELVRDGLGGVDLLDGAIYLEVVVVHDEAEVVQLVVAGEHGRLPHLPLLDLPVAQQAIDAVGVTPVLGGQCHAHGRRDSLAQ